jgi:predicted transcriptional regulator
MLNGTIEEEEIVFKAVQDYLNENKILDRENVINHIKSYFSKVSINISENGIRKHLESLIKKKRLVEGSKLTQDNILKSSKRKKVYNYILKNPGTYFFKIVKEVNMSQQNVYWHVNMLLKFNLIRTGNVDNHEIYCEADMKEDEAKKAYFLQNTESKKILDYLKKTSSAFKKTELSEELNMDPKTVAKYLNILEKFNLVKKEKYSEKEILYFIK